MTEIDIRNFKITKEEPFIVSIEIEEGTEDLSLKMKDFKEALRDLDIQGLPLGQKKKNIFKEKLKEQLRFRPSVAPIIL